MSKVSNGRVLVVDDDLQVLSLLRRILLVEGFEPDVYEDGESALVKAQLAPPDLMVLDLMLPGLDGLEVCRRMRQMSQAPILMLTARDAVADRVAGLEVGADDYKGFQPAHVAGRDRERSGCAGAGVQRDDRAHRDRLQQRQFLADTSHELRNPLTVIRGNLGLLRQDVDADNRVIAALEAEAEAARMSRLVDSLLLLARADAGQEVQHSPVRLDELVDQVVTRARTVADGRQLRLAGRAPATVRGDYDRLTQVLWNLVENALRYTPRGKAIELSLQRVGRKAVLVVADEGVGIAPEHLPHIFERFYRVDKARSRQSGGSGLGLAIVDYLVRTHGGTIEVTSVPGQGTRFTIRLPLADEAPAAAGRPRRRRPARPTPARRAAAG